MDNIYVLKKKKLLYGPYSMETIKQKGFKETDLVWYEGLEDWTPVKQVADLLVFIKQEQKGQQKPKTFFEKLFGFLN